MRRLPIVLLATLALSGGVVVLPVWAPPGPEAVPVRTSAHEVELGSVDEPAPEADVRRGTSAPGDAVPAEAAVLSVTRDDVPEFSLVGVTWAFDPATAGTVVQVRARTESGAWGPWTEVGVEDAALDPESGAQPGARTGTEPLWTGPSRGVQVELVSPSGPAPEDVRLDLIDPGTSPADSSPGEPEITDAADAATTMPAVYARAQWGADERLRTWAPEYASRLKAATIHHTAGSNSYTAADVPAILRSIYTYHAKTLRWGDIGYNVLVDKYGRLWEGRSGGLGRAVIGAHAGGFNTGTTGVSMIGNYDTVATTQPMIDSIVGFLSWKLSLHAIDPRGKVTLTSSGGGTSRYAAGQEVTLPTVFAHRDVGSTACPGRYGFARMGEIRDRVAGGAVGVWRIQNRYDSDPALRTQLGAVVTKPTLLPDGVGGHAQYQNGSLFYSPATGVRHVPVSPVRNRWAVLSWERGRLGYPTSDSRKTPDGGWYGHFQGGSVYSRPASSAAFVVSGAIRSRWAALGWERSPSLGYPTSDVTTAPNATGQFAHFQRGSIYWSAATGARVVAEPVKSEWKRLSWERGWLRYPTSDVAWTGDRRAHIGHFTGGTVFVVDGTAFALPLPFARAWQRTGATRSPLGYPTAVEAPEPDGGKSVAFEHGTVYLDAAGTAAALHGAVEDAFDLEGGVTGDLGWPRSDVVVTSDGRAEYAHFTGGSVVVVDDTLHVVPAPFSEAWVRNVGALGYPTSGVQTLPGSQVSTMSFERGTVYADPDGVHRTLTGAVHAAYLAAGGTAGVLGLPTTDVRTTPDGRGSFAHFVGGSVYATSSTGARVLTGPVRERWVAAGSERGLGFPTSSVAPTADGRGAFAHFERGSIFWTQAGGARVVSGAVRTQFGATGWERGIGFPVTDVRATPDRAGEYAHFEKGSIYWTPATGARTVSGPIRDRWAATGWERGLGYPTSSVAATPDRAGQYAHFQRGSVYWTASTGARAVRGVFRTAWARSGWERGSLGYPKSEARAVTGGSRQDFQRGWITVSKATGRATVTIR